MTLCTHLPPLISPKCLKFSPDGNELYCAGSGRVIAAWDISSPKSKPKSVEFKGHMAAIKCLDIGKKKAVSGGLDRTVRVWARLGAKEVTRFTGHKGTLLSVSLSPDEETVASSGKDGIVRIWEADTAIQFHKIMGYNHSYDTNVLKFSPDGSLLAGGSNDDAIRGESERGAKAKGGAESETTNRILRLILRRAARSEAARSEATVLHEQ